MSKVTLKIEVGEEAYKIIMNTSVIANEEMLLKGSTKDLKMTIAMLKLIDAIHEATPITESDDAVSRQAVIGYLKRTYNSGMGKKKSQEYNIEYVSKLPSVTLKREQGEWIFEEVGVRTQVLKCSKCGTIIQRGENFTQEEFRKYINDILREKCITLNNFCPNCGEKMSSL